jgi:hypothetical protein
MIKKEFLPISAGLFIDMMLATLAGGRRGEQRHWRMPH